jgi:hypothetical protein
MIAQVSASRLAARVAGVVVQAPVLVERFRVVLSKVVVRHRGCLLEQPGVLTGGSGGRRLRKDAFRELPYPRHDENMGDELNTGLFGIPKEGYGTSNNVKGVFGPPTFERAKFNAEPGEQRVDIKLIY